MTKISGSRSGFALVVVIMLVAILAVMVPAMVQWTMEEGRASTRQKASTKTFHLAEAALDRGYWKLLESQANWTATSSGTISGYNFDKNYADISGGEYAIQISSYPGDAEKRIVEGVGKDASTGEVRRIRAVYANAGAVTTAIKAKKTVTVGAAVRVHWGPVMSGTSITTGGRTFPRFYSAGNISPQDTDGAGGVNSDYRQWWSYYQVPEMPPIDLDFYQSSAANSGTPPNSKCGTSYYSTTGRTFKGCQDTSGKPYFIMGDVNFSAGSGGNYIVGTVIVMGNLSISGNGGGSGSYNAQIPPLAWKEYRNQWDQYQLYDSAAPATYDDAVLENYTAGSSAVYPLTNVLLHGFVYVGGSQGLTGGGNAVVHGAMVTANDATVGTSNFDLYYDGNVAAAVRMTNLSLSRESWDEVSPVWPSGL